MTDTSMVPETPNVAETAHFLRRFADMMSVGHNANFLHHAAVWLETLSVRLAAAQDEEQLWRYKYETIAQHTDELEAECEALKHDADGHQDVLASAIAERDALRATLQAREAELSRLEADLDRERADGAATSQTHQQALAELRASFDPERARLAAAAEQRGEELEQLRQQMAEQAKAHELALSELRLGFAGERHDLTARIKVGADELAAFRVVSERERGALLTKVMDLEAKRAALRTAFERIGEFKNQAGEARDDAGGSIPRIAEAEAALSPAQPGGSAAIGDANVVVPKATLRQARSQFEYLATEFTGAGDVASQVMCELGAFTMERALGSHRKPDHLPVGDVALSILASPGSLAPAGAGTR